MSAMCAKPSPLHNWQAYRTNMMGSSTAGMHKTILPSAAGGAPPVARTPQIQRPPAPVAWQPPPPPVNFTQSLAAMCPLVPYQAIYHMVQQPTNVAPPPPPSAGAMMHYYAPVRLTQIRQSLSGDRILLKAIPATIHSIDTINHRLIL